MEDEDKHKPLVMLTYNPGREEFGFVYNDTHDVFTNKPEMTKKLPEPEPPTTGVTLSEIEPITHSDREKDKTVENLVKDLTNDIGDSATKIMILYKWVTQQNLEVAQFEFTSNFNTVKYQLQRLKDKKNSYAAFFALLCHYAEVPCVIIHGFVKGSKYTSIGKKMLKEHIREWNAVLIEKEWHLIDTFWGSRTKHSMSPDMWFLFPDPEKLIFSHLPKTPKWQLIKHPISQSKFEKQAFLKQRFFEMDMGLWNQRECLMEAKDGEVEIQFQLKSENYEIQMFKCVPSIKEVINEDTKNKVWRDVTLPEDVQLDFIHTQNDREEDEEEEDTETAINAEDNSEKDIFSTSNKETKTLLSITVRFPKEGVYKLEIIGREKQPEFDWVAIFQVKVDSVPDWLVLFPIVSDIGWGPNPYMRQCGIGPLTHKKGMFKCYPGQIDMKFGIYKKAPTKNITLRYKIVDYGKNNVEDESDPTEEEMIEYRPVNSVFTLPILLDQFGQNKIEIYATLNGTDKGNVCNYLIECQKVGVDAETLQRVIADLQAAKKSREIDDLQKATEETVSLGIHPHYQVKDHFRAAMRLLTRLINLEESLKTIEQVNEKIILTIKTYNNPDESILKVMTATLIIIYDSEGRTLPKLSWENIKTELTLLGGRKNFKHRIQQVHVDNLSKEGVNKARKELKGLDIKDTIGVSPQVASFAKWLHSILENHKFLQEKY